MRLAMSVLPSVVSDGSPGSPFAAFSEFVDDLRRLLGGFVASSELADFLCLELLDSGAVDSPSSPDASREDGCIRSTAEGFFIAAESVVVLFLLPALELADDGEDIALVKLEDASGKS